MIGYISKRLFGLNIRESRGKITVEGIDTYYLLMDIQNTWETSRIGSNLFTSVRSYAFSFYAFFAIDVDYIIRKLSEQSNTKLGKRAYIKLREALIENTWLANINKNFPSIFDKSALKEIKYDLLKHQSEFIDYYDKIIPKYNLRGLLFAGSAGSGKTIGSIAVACCYKSTNVIVVSPKNAVFRVWEKTLKEEMAVKQTVWVHASGEPMPEPSENRWFIFHYESLDKAVELANRLKDEKCTIILDESHNLNDIKSLRTERFVGMCQMMKNSLIVELSGTPLKAMGFESIPLLKAIDPLFNDDCVVAYKKIYGREAKRATEVLANRLGIIMYKVERQETTIQEPIEHIVKVQVKDSYLYTLEHIKKEMIVFIKERQAFYDKNKAKFEHQYWTAIKLFKESRTYLDPDVKDKTKLYLQYVDKFSRYGYDPVTDPQKAAFCNDFEKRYIMPSLDNVTRRNFKDAKSVVKYVDLKIRGECLGIVLGRARTRCNKAIVESLDFRELIDNAEKKTLIFSSYVEVVNATNEKLTSEGYRCLTVFAETNKDLPKMVKQFGDDESINPMIATYQSLSTAVPLTMANRVILLNAPFRIHEKEQTIARANRIGQDRTVEVFNVFLDTGNEPNISTRSGDILEWSREQVNNLMGFKNNLDVSIESIDFDIEEIIIDDTDSDYDDIEIIANAEDDSVINDLIKHETLNFSLEGYTPRYLISAVKDVDGENIRFEHRDINMIAKQAGVKTLNLTLRTFLKVIGWTSVKGYETLKSGAMLAKMKYLENKKAKNEKGEEVDLSQYIPLVVGKENKDMILHKADGKEMVRYISKENKLVPMKTSLLRWFLDWIKSPE